MHGSGWFRTKEKVTSAFFLTKTLIQRWSLVYSVNKFINPYLALKVVFKNQHCLGGRGEIVSKTLKSVLTQHLNNIIELEGGGIRELMLDADKLKQVLKYWKVSFCKCLKQLLSLIVSRFWQVCRLQFSVCFVLHLLRQWFVTKEKVR